MKLNDLKQSLDIFIKYNQDMFYIVEENMISIGNEKLIEKMSTQDIGRLVRFGWTYDQEEELFVMKHKCNED